MSRPAFHSCTAQETVAEGDPQSNGAAEISVHVVTGHARPTKLVVESASGVEVPADRGLLTSVMYAVCHKFAPSFRGRSR